MKDNTNLKLTLSDIKKIGRDTISIDEAAEILDVHRVTIYRMIRKKQFPAIKLMSRVRILVLQLEKFLAGEWEPKNKKGGET